MTKIRIFFFVLTIIVVGLVGIFASYYARGYRLNVKALTEKGVFEFQPNGILVIKSEPDGASVYINSELKTATNASLSLSPGTYDVEVKKDGYFSWYKRLTIEKEIVTQASASLFKTVPSLSPVTSGGAVNPVTSDDGTKITFADKTGLWTMDTFSLPLGFPNEPKKITDGDMTNASYTFSPDGNQILLTTSNSVYLIDLGSFTSQAQRVNVASTKNSILTQWSAQRQSKYQDILKNLPPQIDDIFTRKTSALVLSPDQTMILYTASASATIPEGLIPPLPGSSTQEQQRGLQPGATYVFDTKEDRNFLISDQPVNLSDQTDKNSANLPSLRWMPSSRLLLLAGEGQIVVMDYDGTNRQIVYSGSYVAPFAFPYSNTTKLLILTNLGAATSSANLYTLTVK